MKIELRHIRYFLAVAEESHFTRAAARLGIGQPPLSQQIRDLERAIGAALFHRLPHGAELTEAGRAFRDQVLPLLPRLDQAVAAARSAARGLAGQLRLGFTGTVALNPRVPELIRSYRRERPGVDLHPLEASSGVLRAALLEGALDLALLRPALSDPPQMLCLPLFSEPLVAVLPRSMDPTPGQPGLDLSLLAEQALILTPEAVGTALRDAALAACIAAGFAPRLGPPAPQIASILSFVSAELGFTLLPDSMRQLAVENIVYKTITQPQAAVLQVSVALAMRRGPLPPAAAAFLALARQGAPGRAAQVPLPPGILPPA